MSLVYQSNELFCYTLRMEAFIALLPPVTPQTIYIYAVVGGFLPPMLWLSFFLREDKKNPEPKRVILGSFLFGCLSAIFAIPFQGLFAVLFPTATLLISIIVFATVEELAKFFSVQISAIKDRANDEPIDPIIYMLTAAIGFAAMENTLYLIDYLNDFDLLNSLLERSKRFFGATLLHILSSVFVGISLTLSYGKRKKWRPLLLPIGLVCAIALHSIFNILVTGSGSKSLLFGFALVWGALIVTLVALEFLKDFIRDYLTTDDEVHVPKNPFRSATRR